MKEIVIISGKGGTGKTSITASFAYLGGKDIVVADCDVDAADMHLLLKPDFNNSEDFYSGELAIINNEECINCGKCAEVCRFNAVLLNKGIHFIDPISCDGCGYCARICPVEAITNEIQNVGKTYISNTKVANVMVHARLGIAADNFGKLVAKVKNEAKKIAKESKKDFIVVDGSPGIGCPVVSSLSGADFVVLVTEPSVSGLHDLKRVYELIKKFKIKAGCIINKYDINKKVTEKVEEFLVDENIVLISKLLYIEDFTKAMTLGKTIVEYENEELKNIIKESWNKVKQILT